MKRFDKLTSKQQEAVRIAYEGDGGFPRGVAVSTLDALHAAGYARPALNGMVLTHAGAVAYEVAAGLRATFTETELRAALDVALDETAALQKERDTLLELVAASDKEIQSLREIVNAVADRWWELPPVADSEPASL